MSQRSFYRICVIVVFVIVGLSIVFLIWRLKASQIVRISQEQAIQNAIQACPGYGLQPIEQPTEIYAELTTYGKIKSSLLDNVDSDRPVWVVTMIGRWMLVGGPPSDSASNPELSYWDECTIIIDAWTGDSLSLPIE